MAVIYLPEDKRWSLIGQGLGELAGTLAANELKSWDDRRVAQGIQAINADPNIKPEDKALEIQARHGVKGLALQQALLKQQEMRSLMGMQQAHADLFRGQAANLPGIAERTAAETEKARAGAALDTGKLLMQPAELTGIQARTEETQAGTAERQATTQEKQFTLQQQQQQAKALAAFMAMSDADRTNAEKAGNLPEGTFSAASMAGLLAGPKAAAGVVEKGVTAQQSLAQVGPRTEARVKAEQAAKQGTIAIAESANNQFAAAARTAEGLRGVFHTVANDPKSTGGLIMPQIKAFMAKHGYAEDPEFTQMLTASSQLVAASAKDGQGFGGKWKVDVAKEITPGFMKGKTFNMQEMNRIAHDALAWLENKKLNYGPQYNTASVNDAIKQMRDIADKTDSLWWTSDGKVFWHGVQSDPTTLKPLAKGSKEVTTPMQIGSTLYEAKDINDEARERGMTPEAIIAAAKEKAGVQ